MTIVAGMEKKIWWHGFFSTERSTANVFFAFGSPTAGTVGTVRTLTQCNLYQLVSWQLLQRPGIQVDIKDSVHQQTRKTL